MRKKYSNFERHMKKSHNIKRPYKCKLCDAEFSNTTSQAVHMRLHTGERPFKCEYCDESFRCSASYRHHKILQHNIGESHSCEQCSRPYVTKKLLDFIYHGISNSHISFQWFDT